MRRASRACVLPTACTRVYLYTSRLTLLSIREQALEKQALWEIWQDFGVVGTPATDSAGSMRVYAHSTVIRTSAPTAVMLRQKGQ